MRDVELFLRLLANEVYDARLGGMPLRDVTDFKAWLHQCSMVAAKHSQMDAFFAELRNRT
jgi:hypothetical protein